MMNTSEKNLKLRNANSHDAKFLFQIRNDPLTRQNSIFTQPVSWETHIAWLDNTLSNPKRKLYIAQNQNGDKVGMARFDLNDDYAEVSINLAPDFRGKGLGHTLLQQSIDSFIQHNPQIKLINAIIKPQNLPSKKIFSKCGFKLANTQTIQNTPVELWNLQIPNPLTS